MLSTHPGNLSSGTSVLSPSRKSGDLFGRAFFRPPFSSAADPGQNASGVPLMGVRGQQGGAFLQLSDGLGFSMVAPSAQRVLEWGLDLLKRIQVCSCTVP
jgi:hypothetical protein